MIGNDRDKTINGLFELVLSPYQQKKLQWKKTKVIWHFMWWKLVHLCLIGIQILKIIYISKYSLWALNIEN